MNINRVAKVVRVVALRFTALVVVGDGDGMVGVGYGKAGEVPRPSPKGVEEAKNFFKVPDPGHHPAPVMGEDSAGFCCVRLRRVPRCHRRRPGPRRAGVRRCP